MIATTLDEILKIDRTPTIPNLLRASRTVTGSSTVTIEAFDDGSFTVQPHDKGAPTELWYKSAEALFDEERKIVLRSAQASSDIHAALLLARDECGASMKPVNVEKMAAIFHADGSIEVVEFIDSTSHRSIVGWSSKSQLHAALNAYIESLGRDGCPAS